MGSELLAEPEGPKAAVVLGCTLIVPPTGCWGRLPEESCAEPCGVWLSASAVPAMRPTLSTALFRAALSGYWVSMPVGRGPGKLAPACELQESTARQHPSLLLYLSRMNSQWPCQHQHLPADLPGCSAPLPPLPPLPHCPPRWLLCWRCLRARPAPVGRPLAHGWHALLHGHRE